MNETINYMTNEIEILQEDLEDFEFIVQILSEENEALRDLVASWKSIHLEIGLVLEKAARNMIQLHSEVSN